jgi:hypothetical protein
MPTLVTDFNWGNSLRNENPELTRQMSEAYSQTAFCVNTKISKYVTNGLQRPNVDPPANSDFNKNFELGDIYVRTDTDTAWIMTSRTSSNAVTWTKIT